MFTFLKFATEAKESMKNSKNAIQKGKNMVWYAVLMIVKPLLSVQCYDLKQLKPSS